jgi:hypothetical protein
MLWLLTLLSIPAFASYTFSIPKTVIKVTNRTEYPSSAIRISLTLDCRYGFENSGHCGERKSFDLKMDRDGNVAFDGINYILKSKRYSYFASALVSVDFGVEGSVGGFEISFEKLNELKDGLTLYKLPKRSFVPVIDGLSATEIRKRYGASYLGFWWRAELALPHFGISDAHTLRSAADEMAMVDDRVSIYRGAASDATFVNYEIHFTVGYDGPEWKGSFPLKNNSEVVAGVTFNPGFEAGKIPATWNDYSYGLNAEISELSYFAKVVCGADKRITGFLNKNGNYPVTGTCDKYPYVIEVKSFPVKDKKWKDMYLDLRLVIPFTANELAPAEVYDMQTGKKLGETASLNKWRTGF